MKYLRALVLWLLAIIRALLYGWAVAVAFFFRLGAQALGRRRERRRLPRDVRKMSPHDCNPISDPAYRRPDPMIYDQYYLMHLGYAVTWDNPDIQLWQFGSPVPSHALKPDTRESSIQRSGMTARPMPARARALRSGRGGGSA